MYPGRCEPFSLQKCWKITKRPPQWPNIRHSPRRPQVLRLPLKNIYIYHLLYVTLISQLPCIYYLSSMTAHSSATTNHVSVKVSLSYLKSSKSNSYYLYSDTSTFLNTHDLRYTFHVSGTSSQRDSRPLSYFLKENTQQKM